MVTLDDKIEDARVEGWVLDERRESSAVMKKYHPGSTFRHVLVFVLFGWWTFGIANLLYYFHRAKFKTEKKVVRVEDD